MNDQPANIYQITINIVGNGTIIQQGQNCTQNIAQIDGMTGGQVNNGQNAIGQQAYIEAPKMNAILTIAEAADRMQVSRQRMHKLIESYSLETKKLHGRLMVIHEAELDKIPKQRKNNSAAKNQVAIVDDMITTSIPSTTADISGLLEQACQNGDTVSDIARRAGVNRSLVSAIRNRTYASSPSVEQLEKILKALGFKLAILPD